MERDIAQAKYAVYDLARNEQINSEIRVCFYRDHNYDKEFWINAFPASDGLSKPFVVGPDDLHLVTDWISSGEKEVRAY